MSNLFLHIILKILIHIICYRNAPIPCNQHALPQLTAWVEMDHMADVSEEMLMDALSKASQGILQRRKQEYEMWSNGMLHPTENL